MTALRLTTIVSSASEGAERGGLDAAIELGLEYGGWHAEGAALPPIYDTRMRATTSPQAGMARRLNVQDSDGTLIVSFRNELAGVAAFVDKVVEAQRKASLCVCLPVAGDSQMPDEVARTVCEWIREEQISILHVAGPSEEAEPGIQQSTRDVLVWIFEDEVAQRGGGGP